MSPLFNSNKTTSKCILSNGVTNSLGSTLLIKNNIQGNIVLNIIDTDEVSKAFVFSHNMKYSLDKFVSDFSSVTNMAKNVKEGEVGHFYKNSNGDKLYLYVVDGDVIVKIDQNHEQTFFKFSPEDFDVIDRFKNEMVKIVSYNQIQHTQAKKI